MRARSIPALIVSLIPNSFVNRISDIHQEDPPPQFSGGMIADPMGLGKTLTMIALIATDSEPAKEHLAGLEEDECRPVQATLIVVPQPCKR
jgi:hypothetical protein